MRRALIALPLVCGLFVGCSTDTTTPMGSGRDAALSPDSEVRVDSGQADPSDAAPGDVAVEDALVIDAGVADADLPDAQNLDAAAPDAASSDAGISDAASSDASAPDASPPDASSPDAGCVEPQRPPGAPLVIEGMCGLSYATYANRGQMAAIHQIPDFSHAGYMGGGVPLPVATVVQTLNPDADDADDLPRIQAAINAAGQLARGSNGLRGAVLLTAGEYELDGELDITHSGVVLRGEGQGPNGTILKARLRQQHIVVHAASGGGGTGRSTVQGSAVNVVGVVPVGSHDIEVTDTSGFAVGDTIGVVRTPNQGWIDDLGMGQWGWTTGSYTILHERRVVAITQNTLTVDIPIVDTLEPTFGGGRVEKIEIDNRLEQIGIEDLRIESEFDGNDDEDHAWTAIQFSRVQNGWVHGVTARHLGFSAVQFSAGSSFNTAEEVAYIDPVSQITGGRRYPFHVTGGVGNLFQRLYSGDARHTFVSGSRVTGPHVWLDGVARRARSDEGPHHRWATGLLFDNVEGDRINVQNRQDSGTGHGWAGAQVMFWNSVANTFITDAPLGAMNWSVGMTGMQVEGQWAPGEPEGHIESTGTRVTPRSLYLRQLEDRLGTAAVEAVTTPEQRMGRISRLLAGWAGDGRLEDAMEIAICTGVQNAEVCCAASCGTCGGTGCGSRPGGAQACCTTAIRAAMRSCEDFPPPCLVP